MSFSSKVKEELLKKNLKKNFLRDAFIEYGSINDPERSYHLEFCVNNKNIAYEILNYIKKIRDPIINVKISNRKNYYIVYLKSNEDITDLLVYMGASSAAMEVIQVRMLKDVRNYANRATNFETANLDKIVLASENQIRAIKKIEKEHGLSYLPNNLREIAEIRLKNPDMSLKDLGNSLSKPLSRSGVNHRLSKIIKIADET